MRAYRAGQAKAAAGRRHSIRRCWRSHEALRWIHPRVNAVTKREAEGRADRTCWRFADTSLCVRPSRLEDPDAWLGRTAGARDTRRQHARSVGTMRKRPSAARSSLASATGRQLPTPYHLRCGSPATDPSRTDDVRRSPGHSENLRRRRESSRADVSLQAKRLKCSRPPPPGLPMRSCRLPATSRATGSSAVEAERGQ